MSDGKFDGTLVANRFKAVPGALYKHYKGDLYVILATSKREYDPDTKDVVYLSLGTGEVWTREWHEFHGKVTLKVDDEETSKKTVDRFKYLSVNCPITIDMWGRYNVTQKFPG